MIMCSCVTPTGSHALSVSRPLIRISGQFPALSDTKKQVDQFLVKSLENDKIMLDVPFCSEEIDYVLRKLKSGKSAGHDLLQPEHLKHGSEALKIWIQQVSNAIVELESVPNSLKLGIVTPRGWKGSP